MSKNTRINQRASRTSARPVQTTTLPLRKTWPISLCVGLVVGSIVFSSDALAGGPTGGTVVGGSGTITQTGNSTVINQASSRLALNWQTFNVGVNESVLFNQPGRSAVALNRILDQNPSQIFGRINSNGQVFLINTHGIIFGATAQMNVGGLLASTLDLTPSDFLSGHYNLNASGAAAGVVNHGLIQAASGGSVSLVGGSVLNDGLIFANYGKINLDGADHATLDFDGNGLINIQITGDLRQRLDAKESAVTNKGTLKAEDGTVVLQASAAKDLFTNLVNNSGVIDASGISTDGGVVRLVGNGGNVENSGNINVSGVHGGTVQLLSDKDVMVTGGTLNASGSQGGGTIRVGGGIHGGEGLPVADRAYVADGAVLNADATGSGNGGSIAVFSQNNSVIAGSLLARGGVNGGNGGFVETSSHGGLTVASTPQVMARSSSGSGGEWLIDPNNIDIVAGNGTTRINSTSPFLSTGDNASLGVNRILTALTGGGNVTITTGTGGTNAEAGNITLDTDLDYNGKGAGSLTFNAVNNITINNKIFDSSATGTDKLNLSLLAGNNIVLANNISLSGGAATLTATGGSITQTAGMLLSAGTLNATAAKGIGLNTAATLLNVVNTGTTGNINITEADGVTVQALRQNNAANTTGTVSLNSTTGDIGIDDGSVLSQGGLITLTATAGAIADADGGTTASIVNAAGQATLNAGTGIGASDGIDTQVATLAFNNSGANNVALNNGNDALSLDTSSVGTGTLTVSGNGITQVGSITQAAGAGAVSFNAGAGVLTLGNAGNNFTGAIGLIGDNVSLVNNRATVLGTSTVGGTLDVDSKGALTQTGVLTVTGVATFTQNSTTTGATQDINLGSQANDFKSGVTFAAGAGAAINNLSLKNIDATPGTLTLPASVINNLTLNYTNAALTVPVIGVGGALDVTAGGGVTINGDVTTGLGQTYNSAVTLGADATLASTGGGAIDFISTVDGTYNLTVNTGGLTAFGGVVGGATTLTSLTTDAVGATTLGGNVSTTSAQTYNDAVSLGGNATLASSGGGAIDFGSTVDGPHNLIVNTSGLTTLGGAVGSTTKLTSLNIQNAAGSTTLDGNVSTMGAQTYNNAVTLGADTTLVSTANGAVDFVSTLDGAYNFAVNTGGLTTFGGVVGGTTALTSLTTDAAGSTSLGGNVTTTDAQTYNDAVTLGGSDTLTGTTVSLASVTGAGSNLTVTGNAVLGGALSDVNALLISGTTAINTASVSTSGGQTYSSAVTLGANTTLTSTGSGAIDFVSAVDGAHNLTVSSTGGSAIFGGAVGGGTALTGLTTNSGTFSAGDVTINGPLSVTTTAGDIVQGLGVFTVSGASTFSAAGHAITLASLNNFGGTVNLTGGTTQIANSGNLILGSLNTGALTAVSTTGALNLGTGTVAGALSATSNDLLNESVGGLNVTGLASFTLNGGGADVDLSQANDFHGGVTISGAAINNLSLKNTDATPGTLTLPGSVTGDLTLNYTNATLTVSDIGVGGNLDVSAGGTGITINGTVNTGGTQTYNNAVTLGGNTTLISTGNGAIDFVSTLNGAHNLTVNTGGLTTFGGAVGGTTALTTLVTDAAGSTVLGGNVTTSAYQDYEDAVTLGGDATLSSIGSYVLFDSTVDGAHALTVNTPSYAAEFAGNVGGTTALTSLTLGTGGVTYLLGNVTTSGAQTYGSAVDLIGSSPLTLTGSAVDFVSTLDGAQALTVNASGATTFGGAVGGSQALASLTTDAAGTTTMGGNVSTTGAQTYNDAVTLGGDATLVSGGSAIDFGSTVNGAHNLTVNTAGATMFDGVVGGTAALTSLTTDAGGSTSLGGNVTTSGAQHYGDAALLDSNATLATTNSAVTFDSTLDNATATQRSLTINAGSGAVTFTGAAGGGANGALLGLTTHSGIFSANALSIGSGGLSVTTTAGAISQGGAFNVAGASNFNAGANAITLGNGGNDFTGAVSLIGDNVSLVNNAATTLGTSTVGGTLDVGSNGALTQTGALTVTGTATFTQNNTTAGTTQDILLGTQANDFKSGVTIASGTGATINNLSLKNTDATPGTLTLPASVAGDLTLNYTNAALTVPVIGVGGALDVTAGNGITINGNVSTGGGQTYNSAVTLGNDVTLASSGNGAIDFVSTIDGAHNLTVNTGGLTAFGGAVGAISALNNLITDAAGSTTLGGNVTTGGFQYYHDAVTLGGDAILSSAGDFVEFDSTVDGAHALTVNTPSLGTAFLGNVGGTTALTSLTLGTGGITYLLGNVTTSGAQTYGNAVTLLGTSPQTLTGGAVDFVSTLDGAQALTVNASGATTFGGAVGASQALTSLTTDAGGTTTLGGNVSTTGAQTYNDAVALGGDATLASSGGGAIDFGSTVNGAHNLAANTAGATTFGGVVGGTAALASLTTDAGGNTTLSGNVTTSGTQHYGDAVLLGSNATLATTNSAVTFDNTLDNATATQQSLTVNAGGGAVTFTGAAGGGANGALLGLTTHSGTFSANALNIGSGGLSVTTTAGGIAQGGAFTVTGASNFNAGTGAITLANSGNAFGGVVTLTGGVTQITNGSALTLGAVNTGALTAISTGVLNLGSGAVGGNLSATSNNGAVSQGGALTVTGTSGINAGTGAITLANTNNDFTGAVSLTGGATQITDKNALTLGTLSTGALTAVSTGALNLGSGTVGGNLSATSNNGAVSQGGALTVSGTSGINAGTGAITLANANNDFTGAVNLTGGATQITDKNALTLGTLSTGALTAVSTGALNLGSSAVGGNLSATSNGGAISQGGALTVTGTSGINAGIGAITLANSGNAFGGVVNLSGGATQITNGSALTLGVVNTGALTAISTGALNLGSGTVGGNLSATSNNGAVSQSGALAVSGSSTINAGTGTITLANSGNAFDGIVSLTGGATQITNASALTLGALSTGALTVTSGDLAINGVVNSTSATLNSSGAISEGGSGSLTTSNLSGQSTGATSLNGTNHVGTLGSFSAANFGLTNAQSLAVTGPVNGGASTTLTTTAGDLAINGAVSGTLTTLNSAGAITEGASGVITAGTLTGQSVGGTDLNGANLINTLGSFTADFSLTNAQTLTVAGPLDGGPVVTLTTTAGDLIINGAVNGTATTLNSAGAISEGAGGVITADTLSGQSAGATSLNGANHIGTLGSFSAAAFGLTNAQSLAVTGPINGGSTAALTTTAGDLAINGAVNGTTTTLNSAGAISEGAGGSLNGTTLNGQSTGATGLNGTNHIGTLGSFSAAGFGLTNAQALAVTGPINGGSSAALTTTTGGLTINGAVNGTTTTLKSAGAISEGAAGSITASNLSGQSAGATSLNGANHIGTLGSFIAAGFGLTNAQSLAVTGPINGGSSAALTTTAGDLAINGAVNGTTMTLKSAGAINEGAGGSLTASTLSGQSTGATSLNGTNHIGTLGSFSAANFGLTNAQSLAVTGPVNGGASTTLTTTAGDLAINGAVSGNTTTLKSAGAISEGSSGVITAGTLSGHAVGTTTLGSAAQRNNNMVSTLGNFSSPAGFSMTNNKTITLASVAGSAFTVNAGTSAFYLSVTNGDLFQLGTTPVYDGLGTWGSTGRMGTGSAPIYVVGTGLQMIANVGLPPAYFYAIDSSGNLLPLGGGFAVNVPTASGAGGAQNGNHGDSYIDPSVITANYRSYGIVPSGVRLPADQQSGCDPDQPDQADCQDDNSVGMVGIMLNARR